MKSAFITYLFITLAPLPGFASQPLSPYKVVVKVDRKTICPADTLVATCTINAPAGYYYVGIPSHGSFETIDFPFWQGFIEQTNTELQFRVKFKDAHQSNLVYTAYLDIGLAPKYPGIIDSTGRQSFHFSTSRGAMVTIRDPDDCNGRSPVSWARLDSLGGPIHSIAVHPSGDLFVAAGSSLWTTRNKGESWDSVCTLSEDESPLRIRKLAILPSGTMVVGGSEGIDRSTDRGVTWTGVRTDRSSRSLSLVGNGILFNNMHLGRSTDEGLSWTNRDSSLAYLSSHNVWDGPGSSIFMSGAPRYFNVWRPNSRLFISSNLGQTWLRTALDTVVVTALTTSRDGRVYASTSLGEFYVSADTGHTWNQKSRKYAESHSRVIQVMFSNELDGILAAGYKGTRGISFISVTRDEGRTWISCTEGLPQSIQAETLTKDSDGFLFVGTWEGVVYRTIAPFK
ncbi:MAG: WD40/YVTN/BNR-like repeat-containing protein [Bacteroidota bacterium]